MTNYEKGSPKKLWLILAGALVADFVKWYAPSSDRESATHQSR
jgi:hypothetical protein